MRFGFALADVRATWRRREGRPFTLAVDGLSVDLGGGRHMLPLRGQTGAGKTTLMHLLSAMWWPEAGTVTWWLPSEGGTTEHRWGPGALRGGAGAPVSRAMLNDIRRQYFGVTFQDGRLLNHLTVAENLAYPLELRGWTRTRALEEAREQVMVFLTPHEREKVNDLLGHYPDQCSGGQQRRLALAKAVIWGPTVLFADEPSGNLDPDTRKQVMECLSKWAMQGRAGRRAVIWVTHLDDDEVNADAQQRLTVLAPSLTNDDASCASTWELAKLAPAAPLVHC